MGRTVVPNSKFHELVDIYNADGKTAFYDLLRSEYGMKQPYFVLQRIKASDKYEYDPETDRFNTAPRNISEDVFMDLDELCAGQIVGQSAEQDMRPRKIAMEELVNELINDRLLTLSRYITMDCSSRTIIIDQTSLSQDGYRIITH